MTQYVDTIDTDQLKEVPNVAQMSLEDMIDTIGQTKKVLKLLEKQEGYLKEAIKARAPEGEETYGQAFFCIPEACERVGLDSAKIKEEMSEEWVESHSSSTEYVKLTVKARPSE